MTIKEVFELRKQGKIEEAYEAVRPMYAAHQGKYTTLCMFWTASDILKKRIRERHYSEAVKILKALLRILPNIDDADGKAHSSILHQAVALDKSDKSFCMLDFLGLLKVEQLTDNDWATLTMPPTPTNPSHPIPSVGQQLLNCAFHEIREHPSVDNALKAMPLLQEAARRRPHDKNTLRQMAIVYRIMGENEKAKNVYHRLLGRHHDSYLYAELAELTEQPGQKAALLCRAIQEQRQEKFRSGYRLTLAQMLIGRDNAKAAHELQKCIVTRKAMGQSITANMQKMAQQLKNVKATTDTEQQLFYRKMTEKYPL